MGATCTAEIAVGAVAACLLFIVVPGVLLYRRLRYHKGIQKSSTGAFEEDGRVTGERPLELRTGDLHSSDIPAPCVQKRIQQLSLARGGLVRSRRNNTEEDTREGSDVEGALRVCSARRRCADQRARTQRNRAHLSARTYLCIHDTSKLAHRHHVYDPSTLAPTADSPWHHRLPTFPPSPPEVLLYPSELPVVILAMVRKDLVCATNLCARGSAGCRSRWRRARWGERKDVRVKRVVEDVVPGYKNCKLVVKGMVDLGRLGQRRRTWTTREDVARTKLTYGSMRGTTITSKSREEKGELLYVCMLRESKAQRREDAVKMQAAGPSSRHCVDATIPIHEFGVLRHARSLHSDHLAPIHITPRTSSAVPLIVSPSSRLPRRHSLDLLSSLVDPPVSIGMCLD